MEYAYRAEAVFPAAGGELPAFQGKPLRCTMKRANPITGTQLQWKKAERRGSIIEKVQD